MISAILLLLILPLTVAAESSCFDPARNFEANFRSCSQAAEQNDPAAQYFLGQMYRKGDGVTQDYERALHWYRAAAAQGHIPALFNLGWMYDSGVGVKQDQDEAIRWYRMAAERGDGFAAFNLGSIYYARGNSAENLQETYFWFEIALHNGNPKARRWTNKVVERMNSDQQKQAAEKVDQWKQARPHPDDR